MRGIWSQWDGVPYSVTTWNDRGLTGDYEADWSIRAPEIGNPNLLGSRSTSEKLQEWFNTAAFSDGDATTYSNQARNSFRGPGFANLDFAVIKSSTCSSTSFARRPGARGSLGLFLSDEPPRRNNEIPL